MFGDGKSPTDALGEVQAFQSLKTADYVQGQSDVTLMRKEYYYPDTPIASSGNPNDRIQLVHNTPFSWQRRVLFTKAQTETDPQYTLVRDDFLGACPPPTASFWVMADDLKVLPTGAHATGQFGVDLELYVAQPAQPKIGTWQFQHQNWGGEKQLCVRITQPDGKPFLSLLYPRRPAEPMPAFTTLANGDGVKITLPDSMDYAFLAPKPVTYKEGDIAFSGTAGYIRQGQGTAQAVLSNGGTATVNRVTL